MSRSPAIAPAAALAHVDPAFFASLSDKERAVVPYLFDLWLRPEQRLARHAWRALGLVGGRGFGKSFAISVELNRRVRAGVTRSLGLMAPTDDRVEKVQLAFLIATSPPWFRAEFYKGGLVWPNGATAECFTSLEPERPRSSNFDTAWCTELVDWHATTRRAAWNNLTTATRVGASQIFWDTTSKGKNEVILSLLDRHAADPTLYPVQRGTMFDNPLLARDYLRDECTKYSGREYEEEVLGRVFAETAGALWQQTWITRQRVAAPPPLGQRLIAADPALSGSTLADETGLVEGGNAIGPSTTYITHDFSGHYAPEEWGDIVIKRHSLGVTGAIVERNHLGDNATFVIRSRASSAGVEVRVLKDLEPFPEYDRRVLYVREIVAASSKSSRAGGPASETEAGRVWFAGSFPELELQFTTFEPGTAKSPNRFDAAVYLITELRGLRQDGPRRKPKDDAQAARIAHETLRDRLRAINRGIGI